MSPSAPHTLTQAPVLRAEAFQLPPGLRVHLRGLRSALQGVHIDMSKLKARVPLGVYSLSPLLSHPSLSPPVSASHTRRHIHTPPWTHKQFEPLSPSPPSHELAYMHHKRITIPSTHLHLHHQPAQPPFLPPPCCCLPPHPAAAARWRWWWSGHPQEHPA